MVGEKLGKVVDGVLAGLPDEERGRFGAELERCLYDREWCRVHGIKYSDPNVGLARAELYEELYIDNSRGLP